MTDLMWRCWVCFTRNDPRDKQCMVCHHDRGAKASERFPKREAPK